MAHKEALNFYLEAQLIETLLTNNSLHKTAEPHFMTSLLGSIKSYIGEHIDPNDKSDSVMNLIAPGILATTLSAMGFGWWGYLVGLAVEFFHVDIASFLKSIWSEVKQLVSGNKQTSSSQIDSIVDSNIANFNSADTTETSNQNLTRPKTSLLSDARLIKLAMIDFEKQSLKLTNKPFVSLAIFSKRSASVSMIGKIFGWILKVSLASAGLMVASDMIHKWLGQPNALDHNFQEGKGEVASVKSKQTKYRSQPDATLPKSIPIENDPQNIENLLIQWTK